MSDEKEKPVRPARSPEPEKDVQSHPETNFLPPLKMVLAFFDRDSRPRPSKRNRDSKKEHTDERNVEKLIEKLSEKDE